MIETKYWVFWASLLFGVPVGAFVCRLYRPFMYVLFVLMLWSTCEPERTGINFVSREFYRTATRGFEVSLVDICAITLLLGMLLRPGEFKMRTFIPMTFPYLFYVLVIVVSWLLIGDPVEVPPARRAGGYTVTPPPYDYFEVGLYPLFELLKVIRGMFVFWVVVNFMRGERELRALVASLVLMVGYVTGVALHDRYVSGIHRVAATLGHPNNLATYMAMLGTVSLAFALHIRRLFLSSVFYLCVACCGGCVLLTQSRGGLAALVLGLGMIYALVAPFHISLRNAVLTFLAVIGGMLMIGKAADTLTRRFAGGLEGTREDLGYRQLYNLEAVEMARDHAFGVGMGNFSAYSWHEYAERIDPDLPPGAPAHNLWFLSLGELGVLGLLAMVIIWLRYVQVAAWLVFQPMNAFTRTVLYGSICGLLVLHVQSLLQLGYRQGPIYFLMRILMAITFSVRYMVLEQETPRGWFDVVAMILLRIQNIFVGSQMVLAAAATYWHVMLWLVIVCGLVAGGAIAVALPVGLLMGGVLLTGVGVTTESETWTTTAAGRCNGVPRLLAA